MGVVTLHVSVGGHGGVSPGDGGHEPGVVGCVLVAGDGDGVVPVVVLEPERPIADFVGVLEEGDLERDGCPVHELDVGERPPHVREYLGVVGIPDGLGPGIEVQDVVLREGRERWTAIVYEVVHELFGGDVLGGEMPDFFPGAIGGENPLGVLAIGFLGQIDEVGVGCNGGVGFGIDGSFPEHRVGCVQGRVFHGCVSPLN